MTDKEALKLALEAEGVQPSKKSTAITELYALFGAPHNADINLARLNKLLDELMAKPDQEPVACIWEKNDGYKSLEWGGLDEDEIQEIGLKSYTPLYTHLTQRTWVGLTDKERSKIWRDVVKWGDPSHDDVDLMKAIEAKLKELNHD